MLVLGTFAKPLHAQKKEEYDISFLMNKQKFADLEVAYSRKASRISVKLDKIDSLVD